MEPSYVIAFWIVSGIVTAVIASSKGRNTFAWLLIGLALGIFALLMAIAMPAISKSDSSSELVECPDCAELINKKARKCKHCGCVIKADIAEQKPVVTIKRKGPGQSQNDYIDEVVQSLGAVRKGDSYFWTGQTYNSFTELVDAAEGRK